MTILISAAFRVAALIREEALISLWITKSAALIRGQRLFEARYLLEEIQYIRLETYGLNFSVLKQIIKKTRNMEKTITRNNKCEEANYVTQDILYEINFVF